MSKDGQDLVAGEHVVSWRADHARDRFELATAVICIPATLLRALAR